MAVTVTDHRTVVSEADATGGWTGPGTVVTTDPAPVEATASLGATVGATIFDAFFTSAARNLTDAIVYCWVYPRSVTGNTTDANGGLMVHLGDGTNRIAYKVNGADSAAFRHDVGPVFWQCLALDTQNRPASPVTRAGAVGSLNIAAITQIGTTVNSLVAAPGMNPTYLVDIIRLFDPAVNDACAITYTGGTSGDPGTFAEIATDDASTANLKAHGVFRRLGEGAYGCQAPIRFGNATGTASSWFEDKNATVIFEARGFQSGRYRIVLRDNGVGTTTFRLGTKIGTGPSAIGADGCSLITSEGGLFDSATDTDVTDVFVYGTLFQGWSSGVRFRSPQEFISNIFSGCGAVEPNGAVMVNCSVINSSATRALLWNTNVDTDGRLDGCGFVSAGTGHAIEFGADTPTTITLRGVSYAGYALTDGSTGNESVYNNSGKTITINVVGGTVPTVRNGAGSATVIIAGAVTVQLLSTRIDGTPVQDARVLIQAAAGGPFPHQVVVTIANAGTTATVTHTAHGLQTGDKVVITGASHIQNNGVFEITVTNANTYTYTMPSAPGSDPTGTIRSTFAVLSGLTNASGLITMSRVFPDDQPVAGWARKSTAPPLFRTAPVAGTVDSSTGASLAALMILDE
jgi:hypothetical protein